MNTLPSGRRRDIEPVRGSLGLNPRLNKAILFFVGLAGVCAPAGASDQRQALMLTEPQRAHVLEEMRALLTGAQNIVAALARDDMAAVAQHARSLGMAMSKKAEDHLKGVLPKEFMQLGMSVHQDFDLLALDAEALKDPKHTLRQLSESMNKCNACHATYQIRPAAPSPATTAEPHHH